jgi:hypothetical protein
MKKLSVALVALVAMALGAYAADTVTSVNVVGVYDVGIAAGGASDASYSFVSLPMTKLPVARGTVSANTATTITDSNASWGNNVFAVGGSAANEPGNSTYYVEVTSGTFEGRYFILSGNDATSLTFADPGDLTAGDLNGEGYKVIPMTRIRDVFGEPSGQVSLKSGTSANNADNVQLWAGTQWGGAIYHHTAGYYLQAGGGIVDDAVIMRDEGMLVKRSAGESATSVTVMGEVSANDQAIVMDQGYNLIGGMSAVDEVMNNTGLESVLTAGTSANNSDTVQSWGGAAWDGAVYRHTGGYWLQAGGGVVGDTYSIDAGSAYLFKVDGPKTWVRQSPLSN